MCTVIIDSYYNFRFRSFFVFCVSVKFKLFVSLLYVRAILPAKAIPEMIYTASGETLNPTHSLIPFLWHR